MTLADPHLPLNLRCTALLLVINLSSLDYKIVLHGLYRQLVSLFHTHILGDVQMLIYAVRYLVCLIHSYSSHTLLGIVILVLVFPSLIAMFFTS